MAGTDTLADDLIAQLLWAWRSHQTIQLQLLAKIPAEGFACVPTDSRGRDVAGQLAHCNQVRLGWLHFFATGKRPTKAEREPPAAPNRAALKKAFTQSGKAVEQFLSKALRGEAKVRMHGKSPVRWLCYLISHESHHRGSIALALKQNGLRLSQDVALGALWGTWIFGKK